MQRQFQYIYEILSAQNEIKTVSELNSVVPRIYTFGGTAQYGAIESFKATK